MSGKKNDPNSGREQDSQRATSGGGLGQGRETAAGIPDDRSQDKGRPGKGMGGTSDTGGRARASEQMPGADERLQGPVPGSGAGNIRPGEAGKLGSTGGSGFDMTDHDTEDLNQPGQGAEWSRQRGMGPMSRDKDMKDKVSPTDVERNTGKTDDK